MVVGVTGRAMMGVPGAWCVGRKQECVAYSRCVRLPSRIARPAAFSTQTDEWQCRVFKMDFFSGVGMQKAKAKVNTLASMKSGQSPSYLHRGDLDRWRACGRGGSRCHGTLGLGLHLCQRVLMDHQ